MNEVIALPLLLLLRIILFQSSEHGKIKRQFSLFQECYIIYEVYVLVIQ